MLESSVRFMDSILHSKVQRLIFRKARIHGKFWEPFLHYVFHNIFIGIFFKTSINIPEHGKFSTHEKSAKRKTISEVRLCTKRSVQRENDSMMLQSITKRHTFQDASPDISRKRAIVRAFFPEPAGPLKSK